MRNTRLRYRFFVFLALTMIVTTLSACQEEDQIDEEALAPATNVERATQTVSKPDTGVEELTQEPPESAESDVEPISLEEYVSITEFFSLKVPVGWASAEIFPGGAFIMANSEAALDHYTNGSAFEPDDLVINVGFLPYELFRQREVVPLNIQFDATPDLFLQSILPIFRVAGNAVLSDTELVSLNDERDAGLATISDQGREGLVLMFVAGDEVIALVSAVGYPGDMAVYKETIYAIATEAVFNGAQDALFRTFLGG
jgi:hypothetical protein